jgi:signal peptidase
MRRMPRPRAARRDGLGAVRALLVVAFCGACAAVALAATLTVAIPSAGLRLLVVAGGSMEPAIARGSIVAVRPVPLGSLAAGDVVTLRAGDGSIVTHRLLAVRRGGDGSRFLVTRGDAHPVADAAAWPEPALVGRVELSLPLVGYLVAFAATGSGPVALLCLLGFLLLLIRGVDELRLVRRGTPTVAETATQASG